MDDANRSCVFVYLPPAVQCENSELPPVLTPQELETLTGKRRPSAQSRALDFMGVFYRKRPDGSLAVLASHVEAPGIARPPREPNLRLPA